MNREQLDKEIDELIAEEEPRKSRWQAFLESFITRRKRAKRVKNPWRSLEFECWYLAQKMAKHDESMTETLLSMYKECERRARRFRHERTKTES